MALKQKLYLFALLALISPLQLFCQKSSPKKLLSENPQSHYNGENVLSWYGKPGKDITGQLISVTDRQIIFPGINDKIITLPEGFINTKFARDGSSICVLSAKNLKDDGDKRLTLQFYSDKADLIFEFNQKLAYDEPIPEVVVLNENRGFLVGNSAIGKLRFFDVKGVLENEVDLFSASKYDLERIMTIDASADAGIIATLATKRSASPMDSGTPNPSGEPTLFVYSSSGNELWHQSLSQMAGGEIAVSPSGDYILVSAYSSDFRGSLKRATALFDSKGERIEVYDFLFQTISFSPSEKFLLMSDRQTVKTIQLPSGNQVWQYKIKGQDGLITAVQIDKELQSSFILVAKDAFKNGAFVFVEPKLMVLDHLGTLTQTLDFPEREFVNPAMYFSPGSNALGIGFKDGFLKFSILK